MNALPQAPTLAIQSVLFHNDTAALVRAARAVANSAAHAVHEGLISGWVYRLGDCSTTQCVDATTIKNIEAIVSGAGGTMTFTFFDQNKGHGGGHNALAQGADEDYIFVLNPDGVVGADAVGRLVTAVRGDVGVADGRQLPLEHPKQYDAETGETSWASGACMMITREAFESVGGFDHDTFFMYCDDVDLSWRVRLGGWKVVHEPAATMFHDKRLDSRGNYVPGDAERYYSAEAALLLPLKYSRKDVARDVTRILKRSHDPFADKALDEVERRKTAGALPTPIDRNHRVGVFVGRAYAHHRYV